MTSTLDGPSLQYSAWILALATITLGVYLLVVNWKYALNRLISLLLAVAAVNQVAEGFLIGAVNASEAYLPTLLIAITMLMLLPLMVIATLKVFEPDWLQEHWKWARVTQWTVIALAGLPGIIALIDAFVGARSEHATALYYTMLSSDYYSGGYVPLAKYTAGILAPFFKTLNIVVLSLFLLAFCFYVAAFDKKAKPSTKVLGWILFVVVGVSGTLQVISLFFESNGLISLLSMFLYAIAYAYSGFHQMASERQLPRGSLQVRLTALIMVLVTTLLIALGLSILTFANSSAVFFVVSLVGLLVLSFGVWLTVRRNLTPVRSLIETATAIIGGDLSREAPVESEDELGFLATLLNRMIQQLRESITSLEERVARRTADLERRSNQLKAAALVAKEAASIRDVQQMLTHTVQLISSYFNFYHAGIFILDDLQEYAVLQAASSDGGQRMLSRGHKLRVGQVGIVGYVADVGLPRIALDVGEDAVFFNNPELPLTRSEMALPLKARGQVIGVLDVQSVEEAAFTNEDIEVLQVLADQVALALDNARLLKESREALEELRNLYGQQTRQAWRERLERGPLSFRYSRTGLITEDALPEVENLAGADSLGDVKEPVLRMVNGWHEMIVPIILRGQVLGTLVLRREKDQKPWSQTELTIANDFIAQVLPALENARLVEEIQSRAQLGSLVGQISSRIQSSLDLDTVLKTAVQEIGLVVNASRVQIRLRNEEKSSPSAGSALEDGSAVVEQV